jgi:hypothetical protein
MRPYTIAVDFDGTLCKSEFPEIGKPNPRVIKWVRKQSAKGAKIILHTCRENALGRAYLDEAIDFCKRENILIDAVNENPFVVFDEKYGLTKTSRKIYADIYVDDKAINVKNI